MNTDSSKKKQRTKKTKDIPCVYNLSKGKLCGFVSSKVSFGRPERQAYGGYRVPVTYDGKPLSFQTPPMCLPFGVTCYKNNRGSSVVMELDFSQREIVERIADFFYVVQCLDQLTENALVINRLDWMPQCKVEKVSNEDLREKYTALTRVRESKGGSMYPPRLTVKVWPSKSIFFSKQSKMVDNDNMEAVEINNANIPKDTWVETLVECTGLWLSKDSAALAFRLDQGKECAPPKVVALNKDAGYVTQGICKIFA